MNLTRFFEEQISSGAMSYLIEIFLIYSCAWVFFSFSSALGFFLVSHQRITVFELQEGHESLLKSG